jgi:hypothetical protein
MSEKDLICPRHADCTLVNLVPLCPHRVLHKLQYGCKFPCVDGHCRVATKEEIKAEGAKL